MLQRLIEIIESPHPHQGFLGEGHIATAVIDGSDFKRTDPFILLMDDQLDLPGNSPVGGAHPHTGFETVTLVIEGNEKDWETGSFEVMTAGKGIVHTEEITTRTKMRILQLWLVLPPEKRWADPFWQHLLLENVPVIRDEQKEIRVYSGYSNGLTSPIQNQTPLTVVDVTLRPHAEITQHLPSSYNGFIYVLYGSVSVNGTAIGKGKIGWLNVTNTEEESVITFNAEQKGSRFVFYAGAPQKAAIVSHGPFIGDTTEDIARLYREYRQGKMPHLSNLPTERKLVHIKQ